MENVDEMEGTRSVVSRRSFIKGVIASGATVAAAGTMLRNGGPATAQAQAAPGAVERMIRLNVNGQQRTVDVLDQETLAMTLRYKLNLPGTKLGCDRAECGCCTVLIDDVTHYACSILTHQVRGREITTIEGLASPSGELHPVQQAALDEAIDGWQRWTAPTDADAATWPTSASSISKRRCSFAITSRPKPCDKSISISPIPGLKNDTINDG